MAGFGGSPYNSRIMSAATIKAADVKKLRDATGAGMMDCKKALAATNGNFDEAVAELRKKGQKVASKRADRDATEGVVVAKVNADNTKGIIFKLTSESDFVSKNADFVAVAEQMAQVAIDNLPADQAAFEALSYDGGDETIAGKATERTGVIGEKIEVADYAKLEGPLVVAYNHMGNSAGVIVAFNKTGDFVDAGRDVAMQVAAMKPIAVDKDGVDATTVEQEIEIGKEVARNEGKPEAMLEKIAKGKLNKFYKENTLLNQAFVKDGKKTVAQYLQDQDKELTVTAFKHVKLG